MQRLCSFLGQSTSGPCLRNQSLCNADPLPLLRPPVLSRAVSPHRTAMKTRILAENQLEVAADLLKRGELVAFPTETVYGLGADATNDKAVRSIYEAKGRPLDNPLIIHFASIDKVKEVAEVDEGSTAWAIARAFWPGPLTVVLHQKSQGKGPKICKAASAGLSTIGVRVPENDVARRLIDLAGFPVAAPSANRSGKPSPTCAKHVEDDLSGRISAIIDGEVSSVGVESTIIDGTCFPLLVLRPGGITLSQLREVAGDGAVIPYQDPREGDAAPIAPGMKYVHYAPEAPVYFLCEDLGAEDCRAFISKLRDSNPCPSSVALLTSLDPAEVSGCGADSIVRCGEYGDAGSIARALYGCLRRFDKAEGETGAIVCFGFPSEGVGEAVLNRLKKASQKP